LHSSESFIVVIDLLGRGGNSPAATFIPHSSESFV
jgi:hypothetical protein